jgi:hypothetical protein
MMWETFFEEFLTLKVKRELDGDKFASIQFLRSISLSFLNLLKSYRENNKTSLIYTLINSSQELISNLKNEQKTMNLCKKEKSMLYQ